MTHVFTDEKKPANGSATCQNGDAKKNSAGCKDVAPQMVQPPDGGWGWFVVFASFMVHVMADGVTYSFGIFIDIFTKYFQSTNAETAWIVSLLVGVTFCSGPISSFFVNKYGCRAVTIGGTILSVLCLLVSSFATDVWMLYVTVGLGTGLGFGLIYLPAIVSVTVYFEKYRSLATGIAVCGSGVGTLLFGPGIERIILYYGSWQIGMRIVAGLVLNCIIFGMMFKPLEAPKSLECVPLNEKEKDLRKERRESKKSPTRPLSVHHDLSPPRYSGITLESNVNNMRLALSQPALVTRDSQVPSSARSSCGSGIMNRSDVFLRSSIRNIRKRSGSLNDSEENIKFRYSLRSLPNQHEQRGHELEQETIIEDDVPADDNIVKKMLKFTLLKDPIFILFTISNFCTSIGFNVPYVYLVPLATIHGHKEIASYLLSVIGISNTCGRIVLGFVSDNPKINRLLVYNVCLTVCGTATALVIICHSYMSFCIYAAIYGFTSGAYVGLTSVCLCDLVGLDRLTNAFGLLLLFQGMASLIGAPIAGGLYDLTSSYNPGFIVAGCMIAFSGVMLFVIPPIQKRIEQKNQTQKIYVIT